MISSPVSRCQSNLADEVLDYFRFGVLLLNDQTGARVSAIEKELGRNARDINCRVLEQWLSGQGKHPVSWTTLIDVLQDMGLYRLAMDIRKMKHT